MKISSLTFVATLVCACSSAPGSTSETQGSSEELRSRAPTTGRPRPTVVTRPVAPVPAHRVFVTSRSFSSELGGIRGGDNHCREAAERAGLGSNFVALLSHSLIDARSRFALRAPLVNTARSPRRVASGMDDLFDGRLDAPIAWDEHGRRVRRGTPVWTATSADGKRLGGRGHTARDWTSARGAPVGRVGARGGRWLEAGRASNRTARLYCIERRAPIAAENVSVRKTRRGQRLSARLVVAEVPRNADGRPRRTEIPYSFVVKSDLPPLDPRQSSLDFGAAQRGPSGQRVVQGAITVTRPGVYRIVAAFDGRDSAGFPFEGTLGVSVNGGGRGGPFGSFDSLTTPPPVINTSFTCVVAGREGNVDDDPSARSPNTSDINIYGTDLGFHMRHGGESHLLFGDTWVAQFDPNTEEHLAWVGGSGYTEGDLEFDDAFATYEPSVSSICGQNRGGFEWARQDSDDFLPMHLTDEDDDLVGLPALGTPWSGFSIGGQGLALFAGQSVAFGPRITVFDGDREFQHITVPTGVVAVQDDGHPLTWPTASATGQAEDWSWRDIDGETGVGAAFIWGRQGNPFFDLSTPYLAGYPAEYLTALTPNTSNQETTYYYTAGQGGSSWSTDVEDAAPVYTDQLDPHKVSHYSVAWVPPLQRWVMLHGGHLGMTLAEYTAEQQGDIHTGVYARQAPTPWGPWSPPHRVWHPLDEGPGGNGYCTLLWHPDNLGDVDCVQSDVMRGADNFADAVNDFLLGQEYGVAIVEDLTEDIPGPVTKARVYFVMSTWNPYRTVLMETELPLF